MATDPFEDYKARLDYLSRQYDRLWTRFHFFLTVELAIFGFLGYLTFDRRAPEATILPITMGFFVSLLWYVVGAEDRALVEVYRERVGTAARNVAQDPNGPRDFERDHAAAQIGSRWNGLRSWYWPALSMTQIPVTMAMVLVVVWLVLFATWGGFARRYAAQRTIPAAETTDAGRR